MFTDVFYSLPFVLCVGDACEFHVNKAIRLHLYSALKCIQFTREQLVSTRNASLCR